MSEATRSRRLSSGGSAGRVIRPTGSAIPWRRAPRPGRGAPTLGSRATSVVVGFVAVRWSARPSGGSGRERVLELRARVDVQLGEHLVQVILHGAGADEQAGGDVGVGRAVAGEVGDLGL